MTYRTLQQMFGYMELRGLQAGRQVFLNVLRPGWPHQWTIKRIVARR